MAYLKIIQEISKNLKNSFLDYEFTCIFLFCSFIFLLFAILIKNKQIKITAIMFFSIFFAFGFFEFILSFYMPYPETKLYTKYTQKIYTDKVSVIKRKMIFDKTDGKKIFDKDIDNIKYKENFRYASVFDTTQTRYNNFFRYTDCNINSKESYVFLGCSFVFGDGVNDDETLPYYFSKLMNFKNNVINCGICGQATNTALNILNNELFMPLVKPDSQIKHFFYSLYYSHKDRNFRTESICIDDRLYLNNKWTRIKQPLGVFKIVFARSYIFKKFFLNMIDKHNNKFYENYLLNSLMYMDKIAKEKYGSKFTVIVWSEFSEDFIDKLKQLPIDIIVLPKTFNSDKLGYRIQYDGHPTSKAYKEIAELLYKHIA